MFIHSYLVSVFLNRRVHSLVLLFVAIEDAVAEAEKHQTSEDKDELEAAIKALNDAIMPIGAKMYQQASEEEPASDEADEKKVS